VSLLLATSAAPPPALALETVATGMDFPVFLTAPPGDPRLFIPEKGGRIMIIRDGKILPAPFLDLSRQVANGGEQGLLGVAFDPHYANNGRFVVYYADKSGDSHIAVFHVSTDPDRADPASEKVALTIPQPFSSHYGGDVMFGPDGMLYIGVGDGDLGGDAQGYAQNPDDLFGSMLRVGLHDDGTVHAPADNPFVGRAGYRPEIWDTGLRNPWRYSFDRTTGDLYIGDVGQDQREEIDVAVAATGRGRGANYGWPIYEGTSCFASDTSRCTGRGFVLPALEYDHNQGCSVIGGYVYRGNAIPALQGTYFYSDYCKGWLRSFRYVGGQATAKTEWPNLVTKGQVTSFGEDAAGELYVLTQEGSIWKIIPAH
jgi:hypothetical protein